MPPGVEDRQGAAAFPLVAGLTWEEASLEMDNGGPVGIRSFLHSDPLAWDVVRSSFSSAACSGTVPTLSYTSLARAVCLLLVCWDFLLPRKASWSLRNWPQPFYVLCGLRALRLELCRGHIYQDHQCPAGPDQGLFRRSCHAPTDSLTKPSPEPSVTL